MTRKPRKQAPPSTGPEFAGRLRYFEEHKPQITETIRQLVEVESPSDNKQAVDRLGSLLAGRFEALGGHAKFHRTPNFGDHLQVDFPGKSSAKPVLCWVIWTLYIPWALWPPCPAASPAKDSSGPAASI